MEMTPEQRRNARLVATYGITSEQYEAMLATQYGVCAVCLKPPHPQKVLIVDHDHLSGQVRGLLCGSCNTGMGLLGDDPLTLASAIRYLERHGHYDAQPSTPGTEPPPQTQSHLALGEAPDAAAP